MIAAAAARARKRIVRDFVAADATSSDRAMAYDPEDRPVSRRLFRRMVAHGAVQEPAPGRYYLDPDRLDDFRSATRRRALGMVAGTGALLAGLLALGD